MKSLFIAVLWRVGIGVAIAVIGIVLSLLFHGLRIERWFILLGLLCFILAALPYTPGARMTQSRVNGRWVNRAMSSAATDLYRRDMASSLNYSLTMVLIGIVEVAVTAIAYRLIG